MTFAPLALGCGLIGNQCHGGRVTEAWGRGRGGGRNLAADLLSHLSHILTFFGTLILKRVLKLLCSRACNSRGFAVAVRSNEEFGRIPRQGSGNAPNGGLRLRTFQLATELALVVSTAVARLGEGVLSIERSSACARRWFSPLRVGVHRNSRRFVQPLSIREVANCIRSSTPTRASDMGFEEAVEATEILQNRFV